MISPSKENLIPQITIDCVIFGYEHSQLKVLIPKLDFNGDFWALPSGFVHQADDIDEAARKILHFRTGIEHIYLEQFRVFGKVARNHTSFLDRLIELNQDRLSLGETSKADYDWFTKRFISIGYYALVDIGKVQPQLSEIDQIIQWHSIDQLPPMILDHQEIIEEALYTLRRDLDEKLNAFNLLPDTFTMKEVQDVYEAVCAPRKFLRTNFQKKILDLNVLERLEKKFTGAANKAPYLYRFKNRVNPA